MTNNENKNKVSLSALFPENLPQNATAETADLTTENSSQIIANWEPQRDPEPTKPEQSPKPKGRKLLALALAAIIGLSGATGAGAAYWYMRENPTSIAASANSSESVVQSAANINTRTLSNGSGDIVSVVKQTAASVAEISTESRQMSRFAGQYVTQGAGSGVVLTADGYIVTNYHVINGANSITVRTTDGKEYKAALVGRDSQTDLAVLKIDATNLTPATFTDSEGIEVGQLAVAIGNPLGELGGTVTSGIISAKGREITLDGTTMTLLQTSAAVNPGNSGGGLFDGNGYLVGIVNSKSAGSGIEGLAFAIPSNTVKEVIDSILEKGYVSGRPQLGISLVEIANMRTAAMYQLNETGVYINSVLVENQLVVGDRIVKVGDKEIQSATEVSAQISKYKVGDIVPVTVIRNGEQLTLNVTLTEKAPETVQTQM